MIRSLLATALYLSVAFSFVIVPEAEIFKQPTIQPSKTAATNQFPIVLDETQSSPLPVVIWHGLGDSSDSDGMQDVIDIINEVNPGTYVHMVSVGEGTDDRTHSWFGNVNEQIDLVCSQLAEDPILASAPAINAIGFSQGGQFIRGYIERCTHWAPKVNTLMTFGSQHNGIATFYVCKGWTDWLCYAANLFLKSNIVWTDWVQKKIVPAQYYRPTEDFDNYLEHSNYIADINNERSEKNTTYADNLSQLEKFVMIIFREDKVVIPKESGWFTDYDVTTNTTTLLRDRAIYKEDWIGLKKLDEKGALVFDSVPGGHMQLDEDDLVRLFKTYFNQSSEAPKEPNSTTVIEL